MGEGKGGGGVDRGVDGGGAFCGLVAWVFWVSGKVVNYYMI